MPLGQLSWSAIEARVSDPDRCVVVCLPDGGRWLLSAIVDVLSWRAKYDPAMTDLEWDYLQSLVTATREGLDCAMGCEDLAATFAGDPGDIFPDPSPVPGGGGGTLQWWGDDDDVFDSSRDLDTDPYPITDYTDPDGGGTVPDADWEQYICGAAGVMIDAVIQALKWAKLMTGLESFAARVLEFITKRVLGYLIPGLADDVVLESMDSSLSFVTFLKDAQSADLQQAIDILEQSKMSLQQEIACAQTAAAARTAFLTAIALLVSSPTVVGLIGILAPVSLVALIFEGLWGGPFSAGCDCQEQLVFNGFQLVPFASINITNWSYGGSHSWAGASVSLTNTAVRPGDQNGRIRWNPDSLQGLMSHHGGIYFKWETLTIDAGNGAVGFEGDVGLGGSGDGVANIDNAPSRSLPLTIAAMHPTDQSALYTGGSHESADFIAWWDALGLKATNADAVTYPDLTLCDMFSLSADPADEPYTVTITGKIYEIQTDRD